MNGSRRPRVAAEGIPFVAGTAALTVAAWLLGGPAAAALPFALFALALLVFHDPIQDLSAAPRGALSPVDGRVKELGVVEDGLPDGRAAQRILIRIHGLGTYTARAPVEGTIMDLHGANRRPTAAMQATGLWLRTDEGVDVVLSFRGLVFGLEPRSMVTYGERIGQGQPCACLRLARYAEVRLPIDSRIAVAVGQRVAAGVDVLGKLRPQSPEK